MKIKIAVFLFSIVSVISFTALSTTKQASSKEKSTAKTSQVSSGQTMDDKDQFN